MMMTMAEIVQTVSVRGLPYMTSTQKGDVGVRKCPNSRTNSKDFENKEGEGVKKMINLVDVIYGSP